MEAGPSIKQMRDFMRQHDVQPPEPPGRNGGRHDDRGFGADVRRKYRRGAQVVSSAGATECSRSAQWKDNVELRVRCDRFCVLGAVK